MTITSMDLASVILRALVRLQSAKSMKINFSIMILYGGYATREINDNN